jgi:uncharacterized protein YciI
MTELQEFLCVLRPVRAAMVDDSTDEEDRVVNAHFRYHQDLTAKGIDILVGRTQDTGADTIGLVIFRAESEEAALQMVNNDPAVKNGVMTATVYPYKIALMGN